MSGGLLTLCKYVFLAVLYLFFLRVLRAVWVELREPKVAPVAAPAPGAAAIPDDAPPAPRARRRNRRGGSDPANAHLRITDPSGQASRRFELGDELTVGRAPGCGVSLPDDTFISQVHARIFRRDGDYWVEDLGSTNGTLLNDRRVSAPAPLRPGDVLTVGRTALAMSL